MDRRHFLSLAGLAGTGLLAACSTGSSGGQSTTSSASGTAGATSGTSAAAGPEAGALPASVTHVFGTTRIEQEPKRIVTIGPSDADFVVDLGLLPVGICAASWGGNANKSTDWLDEATRKLGGDPTAIPRIDTTDGIPAATIAALQPDLILGTYSGMTDKEYAALSKIAPTVAYPKLPWSTSWQDQNRLIGQAVGRPAAAATQAKRMDEAFAKAAADHPELAKVSVAWIWFTPDDMSTLGYYTAHDQRDIILRDLGTKASPTVEAASKDTKSFMGQLSAEKASTFDADVVVFDASTAGMTDKVLAHPLLGSTPALKAGNYLQLTDPVEYLTISLTSPLTVPVATQGFIPRLAEVAARASA